MKALMSSSDKLFVPMFAEALVMSMDKQTLDRQKITYADVRPRLGYFDQTILGDSLQPDGKPLPPPDYGIHLHWNLPKALKHAFVDDTTDADMQFPYAPNRWMIIRYASDSGLDAIPTKAWIVESDYINDIDNLPLSQADPNFLSAVNNQLAVQKLGRNFVYTAPYKDTPTASPFLTAVTPGNPFFSTFYPGCKNVFGFYDDMTDAAGKPITGGTFTYVITGWYDDPAADPISPLSFTTAVNSQQEKELKQQRWFKEKWEYSGKDYPQQSLFHAAIHSVAWVPNAPAGVPDGPVNLAIGNTAVEAFSARMLNEGPSADAGMEDLLNALQYQLLEDDHHPVSIERIKQESHSRGFHSRKNGLQWEVNRCESDQEPGENDSTTLQFPDVPGAADLLQALNEKQRQLDQQQLTLARWQQEYYSLWYKQALNTVKNYRQDIGYDANKAKLLSQVSAAKMLVSQLTGDVEAARQRINALSVFQSTPNTPASFELKQKECSPFWEANDPVMLFWGDGVGDGTRYNGSSQHTEIHCRTADQFPTGLDVTITDAITVQVTIPGGAATFNVPLLNNLSGDIPVVAIQAVCYEAMLFDQSFATDLALEAFNIAGIGKGKDKKDPTIIAFGQTIAGQQAELLQQVPKDTDKIFFAPFFSITAWQQAWSPLYLSWKVAFYPAFTGIKSLDLTNNPDWTLQDHLFYKANKAVNPGGTSFTFNSITPFSNAVLNNLKRIAPGVTKYDGEQLVAQSLGGFHKYLLTQQPDLQFPPLNYRADSVYNFDSDYTFDQNTMALTGTQGYRLGVNAGVVPVAGQAVASGFFPLRAGELAIVELSIIDLFGQVKKVVVSGNTDNPVAISSGQLSPNAGVKMQPNYVSLSPRLVQPSRVVFNWLDANDQAIFTGGNSNIDPVFGWVVPNYFDSNLMIYDEDGNEILLLQLITDPKSQGGVGLLKKPFPGTDTIPDFSDKKHLSSFINGVSNTVAVTGLLDLATKVNGKISGSAALQNNPAALIAGQPLALARCGVTLESMGFPYNDQSWGKESNPDNGDITSVTFPFYMGDFNRDKDGLVGYVLEGDNSFRTCINAPDFKNAKDPFYKSNASVPVSLNQPLKAMSLLLDPSAGIYINSGILPTEYRELHPFKMNEVLSKLNTSFMAAPFLGEKVAPGIPVPAAVGADWKWVHKSAVTTWEPPTTAQPQKEQPSRFVPLQAYEGWLQFKPVAEGNPTLTTKLTFMADIPTLNTPVPKDQPTIFITENKPVDIEIQVFADAGKMIDLAGAINIDGLATIIKTSDWTSLEVDLYGLVPGKDGSSQIPIASFDVGSNPGKVTHVLNRKARFSVSVLILKIRKAICLPPQQLPSYSLQFSYYDNPAVNPNPKQVTVPVTVQQQGMPEINFTADPQVVAGGNYTTLSWAFADKSISTGNCTFSVFDVGAAKDLLVDGTTNSFVTAVGIGDHTYRLTVSQHGVSKSKSLLVRGLNTQTTGYVKGPNFRTETLCNVCVSKDESIMFALTIGADNGAEKGMGSIYYTADGFSDIWSAINLVPGELGKLAEFATSPVLHLRNVGDTFGQLVFCGGSYSVLTQISARTAIADLDTGLVTVQDCNWTARMGHSCVVFNPAGEDMICLFGGLDAYGNALQDMWASADGIHWNNLDATGANNTQQDPVAMPWSPRCFFGATVEKAQGTKAKKALWIGGGFAEDGGIAVSDIWKLEGRSWSRITQTSGDPLLLPEPYQNSALVYLGKDTRITTGVNYIGVASTAGKIPFFRAIDLDVSGTYTARDRFVPFDDLNSVPFNKLLPFYYKNSLWFMAMAYQGDAGIEYTGVLSWYIAKPGSVLIPSERLSPDIQ